VASLRDTAFERRWTFKWQLTLRSGPTPESGVTATALQDGKRVLTNLIGSGWFVGSLFKMHWDHEPIGTRSAAVCGAKGRQPQQPRTLRRAAAGLRHSRAPKQVHGEGESFGRECQRFLESPFSSVALARRRRRKHFPILSADQLSDFTA